MPGKKRPELAKKQQTERKQASVLLTLIGILALTATVIASFAYKVDVPNIVYAILASIIVPPEVITKYLKGKR